jgi:hypothetical protein
MLSMEERKAVAETMIGMHKSDDDPSRHATAADMCATFAVALYMLFPERGKDGRTITETMAEYLPKYPNPLMHSAFREVDNDSTD